MGSLLGVQCDVLLRPHREVEGRGKAQILGNSLGDLVRRGHFLDRGKVKNKEGHMTYRIPESEKFVAVFSSMASDLPQKYIEMLRQNYRAHNRTVTPAELASAVGYRSAAAVLLHYGLFAHKVKTLLGIFVPLDPGEAHVELFVECDKPGKKMLWELRPEVASALEKLNWT